jgi:hypothetical protein
MLKPLTKQLVIEARRRVRAGETFTSLALEFGCSLSALHKAVRGETWALLTEEPPVEKGEGRGGGVLTLGDVQEGRRACLAGESVQSVASRLGVPYHPLWLACRGRSKEWAHLQDPPPVGKGQSRRKHAVSHEDATPEQASALRRAVSRGVSVKFAWISLGFKDQGLAYHRALAAVRGGEYGIEEEPVTGAPQRGLQEADVREARRLAHARDWEALRELQRKLGIGFQPWRYAVTGVTWADLEGSPPFEGRLSDTPRFELTEEQVARLRNFLAEGHTLQCARESLGLPPVSDGPLRRAARGEGPWALLQNPPPSTLRRYSGLHGCCHFKSKKQDPS